MRVGPKWQVPDPEKGGTLGQRVSVSWLDAYYRGEPSQKETDYWFTEPQGGWNQESRVLNTFDEVPYEAAGARNPESYNREPIPADWTVGTVVKGWVSKAMLYHGYQVDLGYDMDGLIAMLPHEEAWLAVPENMDVFTQVTARIYRMDPAPRARFPIQLELLEPANAVPCMLAPEDHPPSYDIRGLDNFEDLDEATGQDWRSYDEHEPVTLPEEEVEAYMDHFSGRKGKRRTESERVSVSLPTFPDDVL